MNFLENPPTAEYTYQSERILFCQGCGIDTKHALTKSRDSYVCGCGMQNKYSVNAGEIANAMDLRETPDAQERFSDWASEQ